MVAEAPQHEELNVNKVAPFQTEEELYQYWLSLGGAAGWQSNISPEELTNVLSTCMIEKANPAVKMGGWVHEVVVMEETEIAAYIAQVLSRLPKLRKLRIYACKKSWPFDLPAISAVQNAFPMLEFIGLICVPWTEEQVGELAEFFPHLRKASKLLSRGCGIGVYKENGPTQKEEELKAIKKHNKKLEYLV